MPDCLKLRFARPYWWVVSSSDSYSYYDHFQNKRMIAPEYGGDGKKEINEFTDPLMGFPAHWAPNAILFYRGNQFPKRYQQGAFIAFHGSTGIMY